MSSFEIVMESATIGVACFAGFAAFTALDFAGALAAGLFVGAGLRAFDEAEGLTDAAFRTSGLATTFFKGATGFATGLAALAGLLADAVFETDFVDFMKQRKKVKAVLCGGPPAFATPISKEKRFLLPGPEPGRKYCTNFPFQAADDF